MKVGLFNPYFKTMGGGERYFLTVAEFFLRRGDDVTLFWDGDKNLELIKTRFNLDLSGVRFAPDIFFKGSLVDKFFVTKNYDLVFFVSDGSLPFSFAKKNIIHFQVPFNNKSDGILNKIKLSRVSNVVCNSKFTKSYIDKSYGVNSVVIYPPVDVESFEEKKKENIIMSVGRFFGPMHPKKQEIMIREFAGMCKKGLKNWRLVLIGGVTEDSLSEVENLRSKSRGYPITIITDSSFAVLKDYYSKAKIYWHATGYGEDLEKYPQRSEHFGITTVEAMASGCVPVAFNGGGQPEIIAEGKNGYLWNTTEDLDKKTKILINNADTLASLSKSAIKKSQIFSKNVFFDEWEKLLAN